MNADIPATSSPLLLPPTTDRPLPRVAQLGHGGPPVLRLGLATRGNTHLDAAAVEHAVAQGVNYLNWCGHHDGMCQAIREKRFDREQVVLAWQLGARTRSGADRELADALRTLGTDRMDVVTLYYVEEESEWDEICRPGGALELLQQARQRGDIRIIGLTTHQRKLAAKWVESGMLDLLMIRYNAAHRGAEHDVFPTTARLGIPLVAFTAQRWGALTKRTPECPPDLSPPPAREWYRFALANLAVGVVLMAPDNRRELDDNLLLLDDWRPSTADEFERLAAHGRRVRQCAGSFP
jgi:predicted aldo/keto reductase-like oxidoreductase